MSKQKAVTRVLRVFAALPRPISRTAGRILGWLAWHFAKKARHFTETNITHCFPKMPADQRKVLARRAFLQTGELISDLAVTWLWPKEKLRSLITQVDGLDALRSAFEQNRGVLVLTPHLGNWEILFPAIAGQFPLAAMYRPPRQSALEPIIVSARQRNGGEVFPATASGVRHTIRALKSGKVTFVLPDQEPEDSAGIFVPFFGQPALTMTLPARLCQKTQCAVLFAAAYRRHGRFYVEFCHGAFPCDHTMPTDVFCRNMNRSLEALILKSPEQYQWSYKRFYTQPNGRPQIYI